MWPSLSRPLVIAHRGDRAFAPENTLAAFKQAADKGADAIEFDVKLTADGQVIVLHDQTLDRTTSGHGNLKDFPLAVLRELDANKQFPDQFPAEKIPTLAEVFEGVGQRVYMNVELTNYATSNDALVLKVVELVRRHGMEDRVLFSSFLAKNLRKAASLLPKVPCGLLTLSGWMGWWGRTYAWRGEYYALHPYYTNVTPALVNRVHAASKRIQVWTVNAENNLKDMVGMGVDGIITDDPALALKVLGAGP